MQLPIGIGLSLISLHFLSVFNIKKGIDDVTGTQQSACEATLRYQCQNIPFTLIYASFAENYIDEFREMCILHNIQIKIDFATLL